jgi:hypothetical protein
LSITSNDVTIIGSPDPISTDPVTWRIEKEDLHAGEELSIKYTAIVRKTVVVTP